MFSVLWFILKSITDFAKMLFTIQVDNNLSLGLLMCICFIFFPMMLRVIKFIRQDALEELDEAYDSNRTKEIWSFTDHQYYNPNSGKGTAYYTSAHTTRRSRRLR